MQKTNFIVNKCRNKTVLDLGYAGYGSYTLHNEIKKVAKEVSGVDLEESNLGENYFVGNAEELSTFLPKQTYDIIIVGDLIEHVFNQGLLLDSIKLYCKESTEVIITTPNCFSTTYTIPFSFFNVEKVRSDHNLWHSKTTLLQLLKAKEFKIKEFHYRATYTLNGIRPMFRILFRKMFKRFNTGLIVVVGI